MAWPYEHGGFSLEQENSVFNSELHMKIRDRYPLFSIPSNSVILGC